jgi:microcystin-dependent protein
MEPLLGEIVYVAFNFAPVGYLPCNGALLQISQYTALFSLLGTTYGGDGIKTFAIPTYPVKPDPTMKGLYIVAINGIYPSRG